MTTTTADFVVKAGNTLPVPQGTLKGADGNAINGSGATVRFHMRPVGETAWTIDQAATWVNQAGGVARYTWQPGDTDVPGIYESEFFVTFSDGTILSFPNEGYKLIEIFAEEAGTFWPTAEDLALALREEFDEQTRRQMELLLDDVVAAFVGEAEHRFELITETREIRGGFSTDLWLPEPPVTAVASISIDVPGRPLQTLTTDEYRWRSSGQVVRTSGTSGWFSPSWNGPVRFAPWGGNLALVTVEYTHGFAVLPTDVRSVIRSATKRRWSNPDSFESENIGNYTSTYARTTDPRELFTEAELAVAAYYRGVQVA